MCSDKPGCCDYAQHDGGWAGNQRIPGEISSPYRHNLVIAKKPTLLRYNVIGKWVPGEKFVMSSMNPPTGDPLPPPTGHPLPPSYEQYPQASGTPHTEERPYEQYPQLSQTLRTQAGFKDNVQLSYNPRWTLILTSVGLVLGLVFLGGWIFYSPAFAFGSLLIPLSLFIFGGNALAKSPAAYSKAAERFHQGGFVAALRPTGINWIINTSKGHYYKYVYTMADPRVPPDWATTAAQRMSAIASSPNYSTWYTGTLAVDARSAPPRGGGMSTSWDGRPWARPANQIDPTIPAGIYLVYLDFDSDTIVRVALPLEGSDRLLLYPLTKNAVLS